MPDQVKSKPRRRLVYVRDDDIGLWEAADAVATVLGIPVSQVVSDALREWRPIITFRSKDAAA